MVEAASTAHRYTKDIMDNNHDDMSDRRRPSLDYESDGAREVDPHAEKTMRNRLTAQSALRVDVMSGLFDEERNRFRLIGPYVALAIQVAVIVFLIVTVARPVAILTAGTMSVSANAGYVLGTTIVASLIAAFTLSQIRWLWVEDLNAAADNHEGSARQQRERIRQIRTLLGIGTLSSWVRFPQLTFCTAIMAAMAGAIVAGVTPSPLQTQQQSYGSLDTGADPSTTNCWVYVDSPRPNGFAVPTLNGSYLVPITSRGSAGESTCPSERILDALGTESLPVNYLYRVGNALINSTALGIPVSYVNTAAGIYFDNRERRQPLVPPFDQLLSWSSCAPNVHSNPVQCKPAPPGAVSVLSNGSTSISANGCNYTENAISTSAPNSDGHTISQVCPTGPGQATLLIGSIGNQAAALQGLIENPVTAESPGLSYAIQCTVDIWPSIGTREIEWSRTADPSANFFTEFTVAALDNQTSSCDLSWQWTNNGAPQLLPSGSPGLEVLRSDGTLASPLNSLLTVLNENQGTDGWPQTLSSMAALTDGSIIRAGDPAPPYAFSNSRNSFEDALGIVAAAGLTLQWGIPTLAPIASSQLAQQQKWALFAGTWLEQGQRVGSGKWWTIAYIMPELFAIAVILTFLARRRIGHRRKARFTALANSDRQDEHT